MKRSYALFAVIFAVSILIGIQAVEVVEANPFMGFEGKGIDPVPGTKPPTITLYTPTNNTAYFSSNITVSFYASRPQLANAWSSIIYAGYTLDNSKEVKVYSIYDDEPVSVGVAELNKTFAISSLPEGKHSLTIRTFGPVMPNTKYDGQWHSPNKIGVFTMESNSTIQFTVNSQSAMETSQSPQATQPTDTSYSLNPKTLASIASITVIVAVASVSLVYFRRRKGKP
jgi:hypothetical protein